MEQLTLGNVSLRSLDAADNLVVATLANNRRIWDNITDIMPHPYSLTDADDFISMALTSDTEKIFAVDYNGELTGVTGLRLQRDVFRLTAEIGYWLGEPFWNKGIATRAVKLATHYGITRLGLVRIFANVYDFNKSSQRVLEKAGYIFEGIARKAIIKNGVIIDDYRYAFLDDFLRDDYLTIKTL